MKRTIALMLLGATLAGCSEYNPITNPAPDPNPDLPPGTENPTSNSPIQRYEAEDGNGNGYAKSITWNTTTDTFTVDNLAFDGDNTYTRDDVVPSLGPFRVYENASVFNDSVTGTPINQYPHKALVGLSTNTNSNGDPVTSFAIVRTGAYYEYGFGGFMYQREGGVVLPNSGQAAFSGNYAGLRDFNAGGGLEYTTGDMVVNIDFEDFNQGNGVDGHVSNRRIFDVSGNDITASYLALMGVAELPTLNFTVGPGVMDNNGEITGEVTSIHENQVFESGNYYAVLSGEGANMEVVGIIVVSSAHPDSNVQTGIRETGGFILYR